MDKKHQDHQNKEEVKQEAGQKLEELSQELEKEKRDRMQLLADFVNYRKRSENDKADMKVAANKMLLQQIIEIVDDFDRALSEGSDKIDQNNEFFKGVLLIQKKLSDLLAMYGLQLLTVKPGDDFDPQTMEAVTTAPATDPKFENKVLHVVGKGYLNKDAGQVFKSVRVVIGKKA